MSSRQRPTPAIDPAFHWSPVDLEHLAVLHHLQLPIQRVALDRLFDELLGSRTSEQPEEGDVGLQQVHLLGTELDAGLRGESLQLRREPEADLAQ